MTTSSEHSHSSLLVEQFAAVSREALDFIARLSDDEWRTHCDKEGWSVGVVAHHIATGHLVIVDWVQTAATGHELPPVTMDLFAELNAQHAQEYAHVSKAETLEVWQQNSERAANIVRDISDEQMEYASPFVLLGGALVTPRRLIERILIGHVTGHMQSIHAALGA